MKASRSARVLKWIARIIGLSTAFAWFISTVVSIIFEWGAPVTVEGLVLIILVAINTAAVILAWWLEKTGGILLVIFGMAFFIFGIVSAGHNQFFAGLISGFPFLVAGILFILSWWKSR
jgi:hypothetical protein